MTQKIITFDIGGTKYNADIFDVEKEKLIGDVTKKSSRNLSKDEINSQIVDVSKGYLSKYGNDIIGAGILVPGACSDGVLSNVVNIPGWNGFNLENFLANELNIPVAIENDLNGHALGCLYFQDFDKVVTEHKKINLDYIQKDKYDNFVVMGMGTGLGAGIIIDGRLYTGSFGAAGEIGETPYFGKGINEKKSTVLETYCCGRFFEDIHNIKGEVLNNAIKNDPNSDLAIKANRIMDEFGYHVGNGMSIPIATFAPQAILITGSSGVYNFDLYEGAMRSQLNSISDHIKDMSKETPINPARLDIANIGAGATFCYKNNINIGNKSN